MAALDAQRAAATLRDGRRRGRLDRRRGAPARPPTTSSWCCSRSRATRWSASGTHAVALNLELDDELRREGLAREVVHAVQNARKDAGLNVEDRISLTLGGDDELLEAVRAHEDYVTGETLATSLATTAPTAATSARSRAASCGSRWSGPA